jgi:alpha-1,6-mannosyltransferase
MPIRLGRQRDFFPSLFKSSTCAMKILDLCEFYSERGGGVRSYLTKLGTFAQQAGHELVIVAPGPRDETVKEGGAIIERYSAPRMPYDATYHMPLRLGRMRELVRRHSPDVLQVSSPFVPALVAATLGDDAGAAGMIRTYVYHSDPIGCYLNPWAKKNIPDYFQEALLAPAWTYMRKICRTHDTTVVAGEWLKQELLNHGCNDVVNVDFGINHEDFGPERRNPQLRRRFLGELAENPDARLLVIAGRLAADKRQGRVVQAVAQLSRRRPLGLVVLGDGPERENLMAAAGDIPQAHFLKFTKDRDEYAAILASCDALVHGSLCETYGFVLAETLASGTPFLVPDWGGARALAGPEHSEMYPALAGPDEIAVALDRLLSRDPQKLSEAARRAGLAQPHTRDHFAGLFRLYEEMLSKNRGSLH